MTKRAFQVNDRVRIPKGITLSGDNQEVDDIQAQGLIGDVVNLLGDEDQHYPIKVFFGDGIGIYAFQERELELVEESGVQT